MDLRQLAYVVAVAEEGSFTRAAARCHVVQSALSASVARLERELAVRLFERTSRSVRLSAAGEVLLPHARALIRGAEVAKAEVAAFTGAVSGRLRLGLVGGGGGGPPVVHETLVAFHRRFPGVEVTAADLGSRRMAEQVRDGELDLAFVALYADQAPAGLEHRLLVDEPLVAVVTADHPLASRPAAGLAELAAAGPFVEAAPASGVRLQVDEAFRRVGVTRRVAFELAHPEAVLRFVALGLGVALVPAGVRPPDGVVALPLADGGAGHPLALVHPPRQAMAPGARAFLGLLEEAAGPGGR